MSVDRPVFACTCGVAWGSAEGPCVCEVPAHMLGEPGRDILAERVGNVGLRVLGDEFEGHPGEHNEFDSAGPFAVRNLNPLAASALQGLRDSVLQAFLHRVGEAGEGLVPAIEEVPSSHVADPTLMQRQVPYQATDSRQPSVDTEIVGPVHLV